MSLSLAALSLLAFPFVPQDPVLVIPRDPLASLRYPGWQVGLLRTIEAADLNADGRPDAVVAGLELGTWLQQPDGTFQQGAQVFVDAEHVVEVELFDADGDGDLDAAAATPTSTFCNPTDCGQNLLLLNPGDGLFVDETLTRAPLDDTDDTNDVEAGDLDGDGDLDLVWGHLRSTITSGTDEVWRNEGGGVFVSTEPLIGSSPSNTYTVSLLDADQDGDLDLFADRSLWTNDGTGSFSNPIIIPPGSWRPVDSGVAVGYINETL